MTDLKAFFFIVAAAAGSAPKPMSLINERVIDAAIAAHSAVAEKAEDFTRGSNDDPLILEDLLLTVTIGGTLLTQSPLPSSGADSPTFSPSSTIGSYSPTGNSDLIVSNAVIPNGSLDGTSPDAPDSSFQAERQPSDGGVKEGASTTPTYFPTVISDDKLLSTPPTYYPTSGVNAVAADGISALSLSMLEETHDTFDKTKDENEDKGFANGTPEHASESDEESNNIASKIEQGGGGSEPALSPDQTFATSNTSTLTPTPTPSLAPSLGPHTAEHPTSITEFDETQSRPAGSVFLNNSSNVSKISNSSVTGNASTIQSAPKAGESVNANSDIAASPSPGPYATIPVEGPVGNESSQVEGETSAQMENEEGASSLEDGPLAESPVLPRPPHQDVTDPTSIPVKLPQIICDITISQSLLETFEQKKALLYTMENTVNRILRANLPSTLYGYLGVAFDVQVLENDSNSEYPLRRLHAFFNGTASFSLQGAPTEQDIVKLLLVHFDVDAFNQNLRAPLRDRRLVVLAPQDGGAVVKVNSVFFAVDGSLVLAGSVFDQVPSTTTTLREKDDEGQTAYAFAFFVLVGKK